MSAWILNNKLASFLITVIISLSIYIGFLKFETWSLNNTITDQNHTINTQSDTIKNIVSANKENNSTITKLTEDVSKYSDLLKTQQKRCESQISHYKQMLKDCQEKFPETNSTTVVVNDCKIKIIDSNSSTIKILNSIGR